MSQWSKETVIVRSCGNFCGWLIEQTTPQRFWFHGSGVGQATAAQPPSQVILMCSQAGESQCLSNHGLWTNSASFSWQLVKNANSQAPPLTYWIRNSGGLRERAEIRFKKPCRWFQCIWEPLSRGIPTSSMPISCFVFVCSIPYMFRALRMPT